MPDCPNPRYSPVPPHIILNNLPTCTTHNWSAKASLNISRCFNLWKLLMKRFARPLAGSFFARFSLKLNVKGVQIDFGHPKGQAFSTRSGTISTTSNSCISAITNIGGASENGEIALLLFNDCPCRRKMSASRVCVLFSLVFWKSVLIVVPWNLKHQVLNACFNWMIRNGHRGNGCYTISIHLTLIICGFQDVPGPIQDRGRWSTYPTKEKQKKHHISSTFQLGAN